MTTTTSVDVEVVTSRAAHFELSRKRSDNKNVRPKRALLAASVFCLVFMIVEGTAGFISNSLALLTDAAHMLTDVASLGMSLVAVVASSRQASGLYTFGWQRAEVIGAMFSVLLVWGLVGAILLEGISRFISITQCAQFREGPYTECDTIDAKMMTIVGALGLVVNVVSAGILYVAGHHGHSHGGLERRATEEAEETGGHTHEPESHAHAHVGESHAHADHDHNHQRSAHDDQQSLRSSDSHHTRCNSNVIGVDAATDAATVVASNEGGDHRAVDVQTPRENDHDDHHGHSHMNMNLHGALLHSLSDAVQSVGVILAALVIWIGNNSLGLVPPNRSFYNLADPFCSILFAGMTLYASRRLTLDVFRILMEATPTGVDYDVVMEQLRRVEGVADVHDLHLWSLSPSDAACAVHVELKKCCDGDAVVARVTNVLHGFGVSHSTVQTERGCVRLGLPGSYVGAAAAQDIPKTTLPCGAAAAVAAAPAAVEAAHGCCHHHEHPQTVIGGEHLLNAATTGTSSSTARTLCVPKSKTIQCAT